MERNHFLVHANTIAHGCPHTHIESTSALRENMFHDSILTMDNRRTVTEIPINILHLFFRNSGTTIQPVDINHTALLGKARVVLAILLFDCVIHVRFGETGVRISSKYIVAPIRQT